MLRGRLAILGPTTARALADPLGVADTLVDAALQSLESQGVVLRGSFTPGASTLEWCDRRLLARIHRYTLNRLRAEIEPVSPADFMRFQFEWQHAAPGSRLWGADGLLEIVRTLDGFEVAAGAWESAVLPGRLDKYHPSLLDTLCLTGQVAWARLSQPQSQTRLVRATPVALFLREHAAAWQGLAAAARGENDATPLLSTEARTVLDLLNTRGASFVHEIAAACSLPLNDVAVALGELVSTGLAASDGFAGLRGLIADKESGAREGQMAGRWAALAIGTQSGAPTEAAIELLARALLRRYGVVCRRVLARESNAPPWRALSRVYRQLEARGDIRGGRFVSGLAGEQFALPTAVERLREVRRTPAGDALIVISAADPLNLAGIVTSGDRVAAVAATRICYRNGVPVAAMEGDYIRPLAAIDPSIAADVASALAGRRVPPVISGFVGRVS